MLVAVPLGDKWLARAWLRAQCLPTIEQGTGLQMTASTFPELMRMSARIE